MARRKAAPPRGIIRTPALPAEFAHARYEVDPTLEASIEHWWSVTWRLPPGVEQARSTLPHPSIHVFQEGREARVVGVNRGRYTWTLRGEGRVFAAKFRPGAFRGLWGRSVTELTDRTLPLAEVVGQARAKAYGEALWAAASDDDRIRIATEFFAAVLPPPAANARLLRELVDAVATDRSITTVEALRARSGLHLRELQRWFRDAVGISPKWMIQRYRLHDALTALEAGTGTIAAVAADLGYADQAHFARDFKALVGLTPREYQRLGRPS